MLEEDKIKAQDVVEEQDVHEKTSDQNDLPIYIIGKNALTYYLATQLQDAGNKVIILLEHNKIKNSSSLNTISVKEDRSLTQKRHRFESSFLMSKPAKMVIITTEYDYLNTSLSNISRQKIGDAPVVCFTPIKDISYLRDLLGKNIHPAFFYGFLNYNNKALQILGRASSITICPPQGKDIDKKALEIFNHTTITTNSSEQHLQSFWQYFIAYAVGSIFSASENKKISDILKDKVQKDKIKPLVDEFIALATSEGVVINDRIVLKDIYNTPIKYVYPLHNAIANNQKTEFNLISSIINSVAHKSKTPIPQTNLLLKKLYNQVLTQIYS